MLLQSLYFSRFLPNGSRPLSSFDTQARCPSRKALDLDVLTEKWRTVNSLCTFRLSGLGTFLQSVYILVKFCRWFKFSFLLFQTTIPPKQRKIKFKPRIKLIHNIHIWSSDLRRRKQHLDSWLGKEALLILSYHLFLDSSWWQLFYDLWAFLLDFIDKRLF